MNSPRNIGVKFRDRSDAGDALSEKLVSEGLGSQVIVLGIPRGGVILADIVAKRLESEFDIVIPRKLGAPHNEELAVGAVMQDGTTYLNTYLVNALRLSQEYIEMEKARQISEIARRTATYRKNGTPYRIEGKKAILVDDGIATGATVIASARWVRKQNPSLLLVAVPVAPTQSVEMLEEETDRVIAVHKSRDFGAVGQFYEHFDPVSDGQVQAIMHARGML